MVIGNGSNTENQKQSCQYSLEISHLKLPTPLLQLDWLNAAFSAYPDGGLGTFFLEA